MSRDLTSGANTAAQAEVVRPVLMCKLEFDGGDVLANSSPYTITYDSDDYLGVGNMGNVSNVQESPSLSAQGITLTLSGIPSDYISISLSEDYQGRTGTIFLAFLDEDHALIDDPLPMFIGRMDTMSIEIGDSASILLAVENRLADWHRPRIRRFTHEDQQQEYPGDTGLEYVAKIEDLEIVWGKV